MDERMTTIIRLGEDPVYKRPASGSASKLLGLREDVRERSWP